RPGPAAVTDIRINPDPVRRGADRPLASGGGTDRETAAAAFFTERDDAGRDRVTACSRDGGHNGANHDVDRNYVPLSVVESRHLIEETRIEVGEESALLLRPAGIGSKDYTVVDLGRVKAHVQITRIDHDPGRFFGICRQ